MLMSQWSRGARGALRGVFGVVLGGASAFGQVVPPPGEPVPVQPLPEIVCDPRQGPWRAELASPGGALPFHFELRRLGGEDVERLAITIINGPERIEVPESTFDGCTVEMLMPHYDSKIVADLSNDGRRLEGEWTKRTSDHVFARMRFRADFDAGDPDPRFTPVETPGDLPEYTPELFPRTWRVDFESSEDAAVGKFELQEDGRLLGTFLTTTGDYRYLEGSFEHGRLRLSCFDGAHAFLFDASMLTDGTLEGDFWSRDSWHETWTAEADEDAALPDAMGQTLWTGDAALSELRFPDLEGRLRSLDDPEFRGRARIIEVFGTWCPNCNDHAKLMGELDERYGDRGLSILGLAFEVSGNLERNIRQVERFRALHEVSYPVLIAGRSDKAEATRTLRVLDRVRSYPTTIFLDSENSVRAIHTGFSGPATGDAHQRLREQFFEVVEALLRED